MSTLTLKAGIEQRLRMLIPEVRSVESVETA
jgi:Fe-S cluster biogenesis protein NfuA